MRYIYITVLLSFVSAHTSACDGGYLWRERLKQEANTLGAIYQGRPNPTAPRHVGEPLQSGTTLGVTLLGMLLLRKRIRK